MGESRGGGGSGSKDRKDQIATAPLATARQRRQAAGGVLRRARGGAAAILDSRIDAFFRYDPTLKGALTVLAVALVLAAAIRAIGGAERGPRFMGLAVAVAILFGCASAEGAAGLPAAAPAQTIFFLALLGGLAGFALDLARRPIGPVRAAIVIFPALCLLWIAWRPIVAGVPIGQVLALAALWAGTALFLWRIERAEAAGGGLSAAIMVVVAAVGIGAVALLAKAPALPALAVVVAAAAGALVLWGGVQWMARGVRGPFGLAALFGGGGALVAIADVLALNTPNANAVALAVLALVAFADLAARRIDVGKGVGGRIAGPPLFVAVAAIPAVAAIAIAYLAAV